MIVLAGCEPGQPSSSVQTGEFRDYFTEVRTVMLDESDIVLGEVSAFFPTEAGDLLIGDAFTHHLMRFDSSGALLGSTGNTGEGPGEFMAFGGILEDAGGMTIVVDQKTSRVTVYEGAFLLDFTRSLAPPAMGPIFNFGGGYVLSERSGRFASRLTIRNREWKEVKTVESPLPMLAKDMPYWKSFGRTLLVANDNRIISAFSLLYPIFVMDEDLDILAEIDQPPPGFREPPALKPGALAGPDMDEKLDEWLAAFDIISNLAIVEDSLLVVVHGSMVMNHDVWSLEYSHERLDVYDLWSLEKLAEDVALPSGSRVLGGRGNGLFLLLDGPPNPWTILEASPSTRFH